MPRAPLFAQGGDGQKWAGIVGDFLQGLNGQAGTYGANMMAQKRDAFNRNADAQAHMMAPMKSGDNVIRWNPQTNKYDTIYDAPGNPMDGLSPTEKEAANIYGYGSDNYKSAVKLAFTNAHGYAPVQMVSDPTTNAVYSEQKIPVPLSGSPAAAPAAPTVGMVKGNYIFRGGNPSDPHAWAPVNAGGAGQSGAATFPDPMNAPGTMTSGRRTVAGNAAVGGVPNSHHLNGDAADYSGASMGDLQNYFGPNAHYLNEGSHIHVTLPGYGQVPYFGARGAAGAP